MTVGNGLRHVIMFSIPLFLISLLNNVYSFADRAIVGHFLGVNAFASLVNSVTVILLFDLIVQGIMIGFRALLGQQIGAKNWNEFAATGSSLVSFMLLFNVVFIAVALLAVKPILILLHTPTELMDAAQTYLFIYIVGLFFGNLSRVFESIIMATGNSRTSFYIGLITNMLNIILDIVLIKVFHWGITAVASTTALSMAISAMLNYFYMRVNLQEMDRLHVPPVRIRWDLMKKGFSLASASIIERVTGAIAAFVTMSVVNGFGTSVIAAYNATNSGVDYIVLMFSVSLGGGFSVYASQNYGAKKYDRIKDTYRNLVWILAGISIVATTSILLFGPYLMRLFINMNQPGAKDMIDAAMRYLYVAAPFYFIVMLSQLSLRALQGIGDVRIVRIVSPIAMGIRILILFTLAVPLGEYVVWWSTPLTWAMMAVPFTLRFVRNQWEKEAIMQDSRMDRASYAGVSK